GDIVPVLDVRPDRTARPISVDDQFLILRTPQRTLALAVDDTLEVAECGEREIHRVHTGNGHDPHPGIIRLPDGLAVIDDVETFLSAHDARALDAALAV